MLECVTIDTLSDVTGWRITATGQWQMRTSPPAPQSEAMTQTAGRFTTLPDQQTIDATVVALEEHGFSVEVVEGSPMPSTTAVPTNRSATR
jgi:hypothetical protein